MGNKRKHEAEKRGREGSLNLFLKDYYRTKDRQDLNTAISLVDEELVNESHNVYREFTHHNKPTYQQQELYGHAQNFIINYLTKEKREKVTIDELVRQIKHAMHLKNNNLINDSPKEQ